MKGMLLFAVRWRPAQIALGCAVLSGISSMMFGYSVITWSLLIVAWVADYFIWLAAWRGWRQSRRPLQWTEDQL